MSQNITQNIDRGRNIFQPSQLRFNEFLFSVITSKKSMVNQKLCTLLLSCSRPISFGFFQGKILRWLDSFLR